MTNPLDHCTKRVLIDTVNITNMDSVNMADEKPAYHRGDVRSKLIETAISCIETDGPAKLSLRKITGLVGVSHNAPYMHFADKDALLDAVIAHGFAGLRTAISKAAGQEPLTKADWRDRVKRGFQAYVAFARDHPGLYALMHIPRARSQTPLGSATQKGEADGAGAATLNRLAATLAAGQELGLVRAGDAGDMALWVWSTLHGLSSLASEDRLAFEGRPLEAVSEAVLDNLVQALAG